MGKISTAFVSYHDHIETSTRSILETRKAADTLTRTKSPTRTLAPASYSSIRKNETAVYSDSGKAMRNRRWHAQNETRNMTDVLSLPKNISHEPRDPPTVKAGVTFSPHFDRDKTTTSYEFSPSTASNTVGKGLHDQSLAFAFIPSINSRSKIIEEFWREFSWEGPYILTQCVIHEQLLLQSQLKHPLTVPSQVAM